MKAKVITELFYRGSCSNLDITEQEFRTTLKTVESLLDNNFAPSIILKALNGSLRSVSRKDLPDYLWNGSLISRNKFYYHHILLLTPNGDYFDPITGQEKKQSFYLENRIRFTLDDLTKYYSDRNDMSTTDKDTVQRQLMYLLNTGLRNTIAEPLDVLLVMIDNAYRFHQEPSSPFNLTDYITVDDTIVSNKVYTLRLLKRHIAEQIAKGYGKEIARA